MSKTNKNALSKALADLKKMIFKADAKTSKVKYKFEIVETAEGATISYPLLEVGAPVTIGTSAGSEVASDGWYVIEEGIEILVTDGVIAEIVQPEVQAEFEDKKDEAETVVAEQVIAVVEEAQAEIETLKTEIETLKEEVSNFSKMDTSIKALTSAVAKFSKAPVSTSVLKTDGKEDKMKSLAGILGKK